MQSQFYIRLVKGYVEKTLTKEEMAVFMDLLSKGELDAYIEADMDNAIKAQFERKKMNKSFAFIKYAAILVLLGLTAFYFLGDKLLGSGDLLATKVVPGHSQAILNLADGTKLALDSNKEDERIKNGLLLSKAIDGALIYDFSKIDINNKKLAIEYSSIETPKGGTYQLILSDGTKIWLNAHSKLKFPLLFDGKKRVVEMEGEIYFEVASDKSRPFIVKAKGQEVKVLGTIFNINAYLNEETVKTTLVKGSVSVITPLSTKVIKPGQEAQVVNNGLVVKDVDVSQSLAWKEGYFKFDKLNVSDIMRQVERWYNIEVIYNDGFKDERFVGKIKRSASIAELIGIFNEGGLKVSLQDRKLYVSNNNK